LNQNLSHKMPYFFDTYAIIEVLNGNPNYKEFENYKIYTSIMNLYEFHYAILKKFNEKTAEYWINKLNFILIDITKEDIITSSKFRLKNIKKKLSFIDCLGYALSLRKNMKFLTGDSGFKDIKNVEFVK